MSLTRVPQGRIIDLRPVRLHLDDLQLLQDLMAEAGQVEIEADGFGATSVEDLAQLHDARIKRLVMKCRTGSRSVVSVDIMTYLQRVYVVDADNESLGLANQVVEVLNRKRRPIARVMPSPLIHAFSGGLVVLGVFLAIVAVIAALEDSDARWLLLALLGLLAMPAIVWLPRLDRSIVVARRAEDAPTFLGRNKDHISLIAISSVMSGLVGFILGWLL